MNRCCFWILLVGLFAAPQSAAQDVDYSRLQPAHTLKGHEASIAEIAVSPDGKSLASASYDKTIRLWDLTTGKGRVQLRSEHTVRALRFSPDSTILAAGSRTIRLIDAATGKEKAAWSGTTETRVLAFSPDGRTLASAGNDKSIRLWDIDAGTERAVLEGHRTRVHELIFSPDGRTLASRAYDEVKIWNAAGKQIGEVEGTVSTMCFSPDGATLTSAIGNRVTHWTISGGKEPTIVEGQEYASYDRFKALLSPDGRTLATIDKDLIGVDLGRGLAPFGKKRCRLVLMDVTSGRERTIVEKRGLENWFGPIWFSPNGEALALWIPRDESIALVDAATGREQARLTAPDNQKFHPVSVPPMAFAPDGRTLVTSHGSSITLWVVEQRTGK